jgi:hypothetical protein
MEVPVVTAVVEPNMEVAVSEARRHKLCLQMHLQSMEMPVVPLLRVVARLLVLAEVAREALVAR